MTRCVTGDDVVDEQLARRPDADEVQQATAVALIGYDASKKGSDDGDEAVSMTLMQRTRTLVKHRRSSTTIASGCQAMQRIMRITTSHSLNAQGGNTNAGVYPL